METNLVGDISNLAVLLKFQSSVKYFVQYCKSKNIRETSLVGDDLVCWLELLVKMFYLHYIIDSASSS